jgi:ketosteroid isomerase-like protein
MAHPNEALTRKGYKAFGTGDLDTLRELFDPNVVWHLSGRGPLAGDYRGVDEVFGVFAKTAELTGGTFKLEIHDVLANDEHVVALVMARGERGGKSLEDPQAHVLHVRDGKVTEFWGHAWDLYAVDDFLS